MMITCFILLQNLCFLPICTMAANSMGRLENKNYNVDAIETIFLIKKKIMLFFRNLDLGGYSL